ncbi:unnamed protein product [Sphenostylis stenocarpa]|uniref:Uncharacterized protein n=1 Tax=Sphenostylis stenocarpa TaxID=92480 RepID=A0AA86SPU6_9FABA|nr:unnamed protein product [Sphenostylis stenocarpa]
MTTGRNLVLLSFIIFSLILLFRKSYFHLNRKYGSRVVYVIYLSLLCFTALFCNCIRLYLISNMYIFFSTVFIGTCAVSGSGGEVNPHSENLQAEAPNVGQVPYRNEAGPSSVRQGGVDSLSTPGAEDMCGTSQPQNEVLSQADEEELREKADDWLLLNLYHIENELQDEISLLRSRENMRALAPERTAHIIEDFGEKYGLDKLP